jgi:uncharacterized protein YjiS (DUF1127 family)
MNAIVGAVRGATSVSAFDRLAANFRAWRERRREIARITRELECYTDRELAELGFCRSDIPDIARGHVAMGE